MTDDDFVKMVEELQKKIEYEEEKTYSQIVIREYQDPTNFGVLKRPDAIGKVTGSCNDMMKITIRAGHGIISDARFWTDGCGATVACGSMLMKMVKGKTIEEVQCISRDDLLKAVDGLPEEHLHCAKLAVDTLHSTLKQLNK
ncbi:MAG: iron-sulfur cluster assembly scaffold protein [Candidatus Thermoplasmatota archaeon]|nr:iron-sulfur cluster assembly scaffold protein [Candidatus Thermoplasmatota archaeon]